MSEPAIQIADSHPEMVHPEIAEAELSYDQQRSAVSMALRAEIIAPVGTTCWVRDLYDATVIYELEGPDGCQLYQRSYTLAADNSVTFGDPQAVRQVLTYEPVSEADTVQTDPPTDDLVEAELTDLELLEFAPLAVTAQ